MSAKHYIVLVIYIYTAIALHKSPLGRINNELFNWPIGKTESQSEFMFKGQLASVLYTPRAEYYTVQQFIGSAIDRQAYNSEKYIIQKFDSIKQKNTLYQVIKHIMNKTCKQNVKPKKYCTVRTIPKFNPNLNFIETETKSIYTGTRPPTSLAWHRHFNIRMQD